ncbi:MAG: MipA/OmpV family protein [Burkholderiales bacterium]
MKRFLLLVAMVLPSLAAAEDTLLGAAVRTRPRYDGSADRTVDVVPLLRYYGAPWFARTTQGILEGGARSSVRRGLDVGAQVAYEQGPRDHDPGASIGVHMEGDRTIGRVPLNGLVRLRQHVDADRGLELDARATVGVYGSRGIAAGLFAQATWASEKHFESYYGVRESGLLFTSIGALASYELTARWQLVGSLEHRHVSDEAARSPLVERRSAVYANAGLAYRF